MSSKVVEANAGIHSLAMAVAVRPVPLFFCCRHRRSMEACVVPLFRLRKPLSSRSRAGACTVRSRQLPSSSTPVIHYRSIFSFDDFFPPHPPIRAFIFIFILFYLCF